MTVQIRIGRNKFQAKVFSRAVFGRSAQNKKSEVSAANELAMDLGRYYLAKRGGLLQDRFLRW